MLKNLCIECKLERCNCDSVCFIHTVILKTHFECHTVITATQDMHEVLLANDQLLIARSSNQVDGLSSCLY
jgi:hypothetical protein